MSIWLELFLWFLLYLILGFLVQTVCKYFIIKKDEIEHKEHSLADVPDIIGILFWPIILIGLCVVHGNEMLSFLIESIARRIFNRNYKERDR